MSEVTAEVEIEAPLAEVWDLYFDQDRWHAWVDGFARVTGIEDDYPHSGGRLVWESIPAGRGVVREQVLEHEPRGLHRVAWQDPASTGELETRFAMLPAGTGPERRTAVSQRLTYRLTDSGPLRAVTDLLFIRSQMRRSLERSLADLATEARQQSRRDQDAEPPQAGGRG